MSLDVHPVLPDYHGANVANVVPELIKQVMGLPGASWLPPAVHGAQQVVLLVLDGLGWEQLQEHSALAPGLSGFTGGPITTVAPSTTAAGLTSIVTGRPPSVHGLVGYRLALDDGDVLDVLKWQRGGVDARSTVPPTEFQTHPAFAANDVPAVVRRHHVGTGFGEAQMHGVRTVGYSVPSSLPVEVWRLAKAGEQFIYAYYDGIDTVAHAHGLGEHYDAELYTADRLVRDLLAGLPSGAALVVTSDHGQVQVGGRTLDIDADVVERCAGFSGEGRFRWLHAAENQDVDELRDLCHERYGDMAWVMSKQEISDAGWFGGALEARVAARLGDVALVASAPIAFRDPHHGGETNMQSRHGSLTSAEMLVPLLAQRV